MVSSYLSRPLRSLREVFEGRQELLRRRLDSEPASPLTPAPKPDRRPPVAPRQPFAVVTGGLAEAPQKQGRKRRGARIQ